MNENCAGLQNEKKVLEGTTASLQEDQIQSREKERKTARELEAAQVVTQGLLDKVARLENKLDAATEEAALQKAEVQRLQTECSKLNNDLARAIEEHEETKERLEAAQKDFQKVQDIMENRKQRIGAGGEEKTCRLAQYQTVTQRSETLKRNFETAFVEPKAMTREKDVSAVETSLGQDPYTFRLAEQPTLLQGEDIDDIDLSEGNPGISEDNVDHIQQSSTRPSEGKSKQAVPSTVLALSSSVQQTATQNRAFTHPSQFRRKKTRDEYAEDIEWIVCLLEGEEDESRFKSVIDLPLETQETLKQRFQDAFKAENITYTNKDAKYHNSFAKMVRTTERRNNLKKGCVRHVVYARGSRSQIRKHADGKTDQACDACIERQSPCAVLMEHEGEIKLCFLPLPLKQRQAVNWTESLYWMKS